MTDGARAARCLAVLAALLLGAPAAHAGPALVPLAQPGPWSAISGLIGYGERLWFVNSVKFVNKDNTGRILLASFKQISNARGTHSNKHLDKVRTTNAVEWNICFSSDCASK